MVLLDEDLLDLHHVEHCLADVGVSAPLNLFSVEKKNPRYRDSNSRPNASEGYEPNELPGKKKKIKITTEKKKKRKKEKNLTVVDPETLFMRNSKLIYCPKKALLHMRNSKLIVFKCHEKALLHIQTTNALGRRPRPYSTYSQPFRPRWEIEASV